MTDRTVYRLAAYTEGWTGKPAVLAKDLRAGDVLADGTPSVPGWIEGTTNYIQGYLVAPWMLIPLQSLAPEPAKPTAVRPSHRDRGRTAVTKAEGKVRALVGDVVDLDDADQVHIYGLVIRTSGGTIAEWSDGSWRALHTKGKCRDTYFTWPVTVLYVPEVTT